MADTTIQDLRRAAQGGDAGAAARLERELARAGGVQLTRWFMRCGLCLSVVAVETGKRPDSTECDLCGGQFTVMGRVHDARLVTKEGERVPCDDRCVFASGPKCDCACGAKNHGNGLLVPFVVTGPIPKLAPMRKGEQSLARAAEFKAELALAESELGERPAYPENMPAMTSADYYEALRPARAWQRRVNALSDAKHAKTHHGRMAKIRMVLEGRAS